MAARCGPGTLCRVPAKVMPYGNVYEPSSFTCVRYGVDHSQNAGDASPAADPAWASGRLDRYAQLSWLVRPVLRPPRRRRVSSRASTERSKPAYVRDRPPNASAPVVMVSNCPSLSGLTSAKPPRA